MARTNIRNKAHEFLIRFSFQNIGTLLRVLNKNVKPVVFSGLEGRGFLGLGLPKIIYVK